MIGFDAAKRAFFDSAAVIRSVDQETRKALSKFGAYVRRDAGQSIVRRKRPSKPGEPPTNQTGLLKRFLFFAYDLAKKSVVIGPARLAGSSGRALPDLEYGGQVEVTAVARRNAYRKTRRKHAAATAALEPRPFMGPAFEKNEPKIAAIWRESGK